MSLTGPHKLRERASRFVHWQRVPRAGTSLIVAVALLAVGATGCGQAVNSVSTTSSAQQEPTTPAQVPLSITNNGATVRAPSVVLSGTSAPGVSVQVDSKPVTVDPSGNWQTRVRLNEDDNTFAVAATKAGFTDNAASATITRELTAAEQAQKDAAKREREAAARQAFINSAKTIPYKQLIKDPESYAGQKVAYQGQIFQIQQSGGEGVMLLSVTDEGYGLWTDEIWVDYHQPVNSAKDDIITVYGMVTGTKTYDTQIGGTRYVPQIDAKYIVEGGAASASTPSTTAPSTPSTSGAPPGTVTGTDSTGHSVGVHCSNNQSSPLPGCDDSPSYNPDGTRQQP